MEREQGLWKQGDLPLKELWAGTGVVKAAV
jgi:hypothetical protein